MSVNRTARPTVTTSATAVPRIAARLFGPAPWASRIVASITATAPTIATASVLSPLRIAGTMKPSTTARLNPSPTSDIAPRQRPNRITTPAKISTSNSSGPWRSKSEIEYSRPGTGSAPGGTTLRTTRSSSPTSTSGSIVPLSSTRLLTAPLSSPLSSRILTSRQVSVSSPAQANSLTDITVAVSDFVTIASPTLVSTSPGHSSAIPTTVARARTATIAAKMRVMLLCPMAGMEAAAPDQPTRNRRLCHSYRPMARSNTKDRKRGKPSLKGEARRYSKLPREEIDKIDYKNIALLQRFITERGKIRSRRVTGLSRRDQSKMARAVKRAREVGLLPYVDASKAVERVGGGGRRRERE